MTKYLKKVLEGAVAERSRELMREICKVNEIEILKGHVSQDHVHLFVRAKSPSFMLVEVVKVFLPRM
ncbi:MAG: transposase [Bacteroidota bacterium]